MTFNPLARHPTVRRRTVKKWCSWKSGYEKLHCPGPMQSGFLVYR